MLMFQDTARHLAGVAAVLCQWRPDEFWQATPAELAIIINAFNDGLAGNIAIGSPLPRSSINRLMERFPDD